MAIGEGAFSSVWRARQNVLDRWVAVKIINEKDSSLRQEWLDEARTQARIPVSCIPAVYDAFVQGRQLYIVMEWIRGAPLNALMERGIQRSEDRSALALAILGALAELHRQGFAHRDLKPANIILSPEQGIHLVDFGFARRSGEGGRSAAGTVKGTPAYMAPEIWGGRVDADLLKADLFSLGKILEGISPGPDWNELIESLLAADPRARPVSADEAWRRMQARSAGSPIDGDALAAPATSELLSQRLLQASRQLLAAGRREEAYWLLTECLREDPDAPAALELMEKFPEDAGRSVRNRRAWWAMASLGFASALLLAFFFGRQAERHTRFPGLESGGDVRSLLLPARRRLAPSATAQFQEFTKVGGRLSGTLFVELPAACDSLTLDAAGVSKAAAAAGLTVAHGEHTLACLDPEGGLISRERLSILPFQRKPVRLRSHARGDRS